MLSLRMDIIHHLPIYFLPFISFMFFVIIRLFIYLLTTFSCELNIFLGMDVC